MATPQKRFGLIVLILLIGIVLIGLFLSFPFLKPIINDYSSRIAFDQTAWHSGDTRDANPKRTQMVDDLLRKTDFHGKTKAEVTMLLGEPTETEYFADWDMVYWLGPERGLMSIDDEWLIFQLGNDDTVIDYKVVTD